MNRESRMGLTVVVTLLTVAASQAAASKRFEWTTKSSEARTLLVELQARIENFQSGGETVELARKLVAADPSFAIGVYYLSAVTPPAEGQTHLKRALELSKTASDGERRFIEAMDKSRANGGANFRDGIAPLEQLAADYPDERLVQVILGQLYQGTGDPAKARRAFEKCESIGPPSNRVHSFLAGNDLLKGKYADARAKFESIEKALPKGTAPAPIRYGVAFSHLYEGHPDAAVRSLETYLAEYRDSGAAQGFPEVFIWNSIARIHLENGELDQAMKSYEKGYESVPGSGLPEDQKQVWFGRLRHGRCRTLARMGKSDEARKEVEAIHQMIEGAGEAGKQYLPAYHYLVGYVELEAGRAAQALEQLKQADPNDPFHNLLLGRAYEKLGDRENAKKTYQAILDSTANGIERALAYPEAKRKAGML